MDRLGNRLPGFEFWLIVLFCASISSSVKQIMEIQGVKAI